jgi:trimeric autotransporter adhesin
MKILSVTKGLMLLLFGLMLPIAAHANPNQSAASLGQFLDESGRLVVPEGFAGTMDPRGFNLSLAEDGTPHFVLSGGTLPDEEKWESFGGVSFGCNGDVQAIAISTSGLVYFGGEFSACGDVAANNIAAYDPVTQEFHSLGKGSQNGVNRAVWALAVMGEDVYAGGEFWLAGGEQANYLARWDGSAWHTIGSGSDNGVTTPGWFAIVKVLATSGSDLYVGGQFSRAGEIDANSVARWDGEQWHALGSTGSNGLNARVNAMVLSGDDVYVGGWFTEAGDIQANRVARWDGSSWHSLGNGEHNGVSASVSSMAISGNQVYVGGSFTQAGETLVSRVARWDGSDWHGLGSGAENGVQGGLNTSVDALAVWGEDIYIGGDFTEAGGAPAHSLARWDGSNWHSLGGGGQVGVGGVRFPEALVLAATGGSLFIGGKFTEAGGQPASRMARWNGSQWYQLGDGVQKAFNDVVEAIAVSGGNVYVGGRFDLVSGQPARGIARWDGSQWHSLGDGVELSGGTGTVHALAVSGDDVYAGGSFNLAGGQSAWGVARWDGSQWHNLGGGVSTGSGSFAGTGSVFALAVSGGNLYVGGQFQRAGALSVNRVARWDGDQWHALSSGGHSGVLGPGFVHVNAFAIHGSDVYVGGAFTSAGSTIANRIARWDGSEWHSLGTGDQNGVSGSSITAVRALAILGDDIYVGGSFYQAGGDSASGLARWDGSQWHTLESGNQNGVGGIYIPPTVRALTVSGNDVYVGGSFTSAGGMTTSYIARWDGAGWSSLGSGAQNGVSSHVNALVASGDGVYIGGEFSLAGGQISTGIARYILPLQISATPSTILVGETSSVVISGGLGAGAVSVELTHGFNHCALNELTLTALAEGECIVKATKAADGEYPEQRKSFPVRIVSKPGVHLVVELDELPANSLDRHGECNEVAYRIRVRNSGPLAADQVRLQLPAPTGLLSPVSWRCLGFDWPCNPGSGQGAMDAVFSLDIGDVIEIDLEACADPSAAFADFRIQASLPDGTMLLFPFEAQVNWSAPINNDGLFRSRFD